jgi:hypothetical protein
MTRSAPHVLLASCACLALAATAVAQTEEARPAERYFYRGLDYGSDAAFNPASEVINGAFGILQISNHWVPLDQIDWRQGFDVTWESLTHPRRTVEAYGYQAFATNELVPGELGWSDLQWVPNYCLHLIGGGARHRGFFEWYDAHDFPAPTAWAWGTTIAHAFAVEAVEHYDKTQPTVDPVADMYLFDPLGALLFTSDRVSRFFSHTLNMGIWSGQPVYNPVANTFENAGENYGLHFFLGDTHRVGLFSYWGMSHLVGVTVRGGELFDWSVGVGGVADELVENGRGSIYARIKLDAGVFVHRNRSLLASLHVSQAWAQQLRFTVYPGVFDVGGLSTGFYTGVRGDEVVIGVSFAKSPVGLAVSR